MYKFCEAVTQHLMAKMLLTESQRTELCNSYIRHLFKLVGFLLRKSSDIWP